MAIPVYLTIQEYISWVREHEAVNQSNEGDDLNANLQYIETCIRTSTAEILGALVPVWGPLPNTEQIKFTLIAPIAHWYAEKQGEKRSYIQAEYEAAQKQLELLRTKKVALLDANGAVIVINPQITPTGDGVDYGISVNTEGVVDAERFWYG